MVLDADDHDTWSAGSFFTNPFLTPEQAAAPARRRAALGAARRHREVERRLADRARRLRQGLDERRPRGSGCRLSTKHTLALTNRGGATTDELLTLAREVRDGVEAGFGVALVNEPVTVGCSL